MAPLLPKGTILKVTAWHDNTAAKKSNPDPNQWVGWGDRTVDEMAHAWINIVYMNDADFKAEVGSAPREGRLDTAATAVVASREVASRKSGRCSSRGTGLFLYPSGRLCDTRKDC